MGKSIKKLFLLVSLVMLSFSALAGTSRAPSYITEVTKEDTPCSQTTGGSDKVVRGRLIVGVTDLRYIHIDGVSRLVGTIETYQVYRNPLDAIKSRGIRDSKFNLFLGGEPILVACEPRPRNKFNYYRVSAAPNK